MPNKNETPSKNIDYEVTSSLVVGGRYYYTCTHSLKNNRLPAPDSTLLSLSLLEVTSYLGIIDPYKVVP